MNSRTLWIAVIVVIIVVWLLFLVAGALVHWNGWGTVVTNLGILERERAALCANGDDSMGKWRGQVRSNWPKNDVETGFEINLPTRPDNVLGRRRTT